VASTSIREDVVKNATDFLTNPRVVSSSTDKKKMFLKTKGLSDDEINEAFRRAGSLQAAVPAQSQYAAQQPQQYQQVVPGARYAPPVPPPPMMFVDLSLLPSTSRPN
jgi:peroxin-14